jgi:hypothetical protein
LTATWPTNGPNTPYTFSRKSKSRKNGRFFNIVKKDAGMSMSQLAKF